MGSACPVRLARQTRHSSMSYGVRRPYHRPTPRCAPAAPGRWMLRASAAGSGAVGVALAGEVSQAFASERLAPTGAERPGDRFEAIQRRNPSQPRAPCPLQ